MEQRGPASQPEQVLDTTITITLPIKGIMASTSEERCDWQLYHIQSSHQKYWAHIVYIEILSHKNIPLRP